MMERNLLLGNGHVLTKRNLCLKEGMVSAIPILLKK